MFSYKKSRQNWAAWGIIPVMDSKTIQQKQPVAEAGQGVKQWLARFEPDTPLIIVPVFEAFDETVECLNSLFEHTAPNIPILLIDDASADPRLAQHFKPLSFKERFGYLRKPANKGFVDSVNLGFELAS